MTSFICSSLVIYKTSNFIIVFHVQYLHSLGYGELRLFCELQITFIKLFIMIVAAILLLVIGQKTIVRMPFAIVVSFESSISNKFNYQEVQLKQNNTLTRLGLGSYF